MQDKEREYLTIPELAKIMGVSRVTIFKKVKKGQIKAKKIGRNYAVPRESLKEILGKSLSEDSKKEIDRAVKRIVKEYGRTLKLLGRD